jgi:hypothetical protein
MKYIDWGIIFKLKEFIDYLCDYDLIQLGMSSKKLKEQLNAKILKDLNFYSLVSNSDYTSSVVKEQNNGMGFTKFHFANPYKSLACELNESKKRFSNDVKKFNQNTKNFVLSDSMGYFYLLYEIPGIFPNITSLVLNDSAFTIEVLLNLLYNLKCLENLELTENAIFEDIGILDEYTVNYPIMLRSLKLGENRVIMIQDKSNSVIINKINQDTSGSYEFNGTHQHLPNLVTFSYYMPYDCPEENDEVMEFIIFNPQIKCLKLSGYVFNNNLFDIIKDLKNLTHLEFKCDLTAEDLQNYEMPVLHGIKYLHLEIYNDFIEDIMKDKFPNVTELVKEIDTGINYQNNILIESFPNLKHLKFILNYGDEIEDFTLCELKYLESLEINFNYDETNFENFKWDVNTCDKLSLVAFTKNPVYIPFEKLNIAQELSKHWNLLHFPHKLAYHKHS